MRIKLKIIYLSLKYFLLVGFLALFLTNFTFQNLFWPFFPNIIIFSIVNLLFSLFFMTLFVRLISPLFCKRLQNDDNKYFVISASLWMTFSLLVTDIFLYPGLSYGAKIMQTLNSVFLLGFFSFLNYYYIIKKV